MAIYRGPGGAGDATNDATSQAIIAVEAANAAALSQTAAAASAATASTAATSATNSATSAANSATAAAASAASITGDVAAAEAAQAAASASASAAATSASNAATSATNAANSASSASSSASSASSSATTASTAATTATTQAANAASAASNASTSATNASNSATAAASSATSAANSATAANSSDINAALSASSAATSANNAANSATAASNSAVAAATSATNASNSASSASTSATNASNSASSASTSATNAASSAAAAAASYDDFDDRYLGSKASAPTLDNDGNALQTGALYFNTSTNTMKVYNGTTWLDAYASLSGALLATNNLSDLNNAATARTNLGLGTAALVADNTLVHLAGTETITGAKTFSTTITGSITGNAGTVTNGVYTTGSYADPTWLTSIAGSKVSGNISGNAATATTATNQSGGTVAATTGSFSSSVTLSGGTANGVAYLNGSKVLTTGSALTFDGSKLTVKGGNAGQFVLDNSGQQYVQQLFKINGADNSGADFLFDGTNSVFNIRTLAVAPIAFSIATSPGTSTEQMRLTSTGLGIGTSSPASYSGYKTLTLNGSTGGLIQIQSNGTGTGRFYSPSAASSIIDTLTGDLRLTADGVLYLGSGSNSVRATLDSSGNLGLGVTPSAWISNFKAIQLPGGAFSSYDTSNLNVIYNAYYDGGWKYKTTNYASFFSQEAGQHRWFTAGSGTAGNAISFTQAMTLDASGRLQIGTTTASGALTVVAPASVNYGSFDAPTASNAYHAYKYNNSVYAYVGQGSSLFSGGSNTDFGFSTSSATNIVLGTNNTERMRIDSSGNLLVGTTSAYVGIGTNLQSTSNSGQLGLRNTNATAGKFWTLGPNGSNNIVCYNNASTGVYIVDGGTSWSGSSDETLKTDLKPIEDAANKVLTLRAVTGRFKADAEDVSRSFLIAQDVQKVLPEAVNEMDGLLGIQYTDVIPLLVAAIKELKAELDATKAEVAALKGA